MKKKSVKQETLYKMINYWKFFLLLSFPARLGIKLGCQFFQFMFSVVWDILASIVWEEK